MRHVESGRCRLALGVLVLVGVLCAGCWIWRGGGTLAPASTTSAAPYGESPGRTSDSLPYGQDEDHAIADHVSDEMTDALEGTLPHALAEDGARTVVWTERGGVEQVATRLLVTYRDGEPCVLCQAGYLDLLGRVWSCVVQGDGWVDVCVVKEGEGASSVTVMRLDSDQAASMLVEEGE